MAERGERTTSIQEKLDVLVKTKDYFCQKLIPSEIVPRLNMLLDKKLRDSILEKELAGNREGGARMLLDRIIEEGERGMNIFLAVLKGEIGHAKWPKILRPLGDLGRVSANEVANDYYAFILHLLEGEIIDRLTPQALERVIIHLYSTEAIFDYEMELLKSTMNNKGRYCAAVQMFTLLNMRDDRWPEKFFLALREECPDLYTKIVPFDEDPVPDKTTDMATGSADNAADLRPERATIEDSSEETLVKNRTAALPQGEGAEHVALVDEEQRRNLNDEEKEADTSSSPPYSRTDDIVDDGSTSSSCDDDEDQGARFSDDEKQNMEVSEKSEKHTAPSRKCRVPKELELREYQKELSQKALQGINTIICAPTGSGKTRVALHIVQEHLKADSRRKVVFLARTVPLVSQQYRNFREYLPHYKCELVTGESENSMTVHHSLDKNHILVLTPKILENHLKPDKIPSLSAFSLIIFDECHHTRKGEPYNSVMKHYLQSKQHCQQGLPQIVGLTASIGVEKATTADEAKESILSIMGNLDVTEISLIRNNLDELRNTVPRPAEKLVTLENREMDCISNTIANAMGKIEEELDSRKVVVETDMAVDEVRRILTKRETDLKSQKYGQWAVNLRNQARLLQRPMTPKNAAETEKLLRRQTFAWEVQVLADWLVAYNEAFDVHDLTRPEDVLHYLEKKSVLQREESEEFISLELDGKVRSYFTDVQKRLERYSQQENPNLLKLGGTILQHIQQAEDDDGFRILVFVRTRATCRALCSWLNNNPSETLRSLNAQPFTGTGAQQELGGMTAYEQVETLKKFKQGDVKLLVTTSVGEEGIDIAECNLTIRYNHVGNEVTTVQTRGRSRKAGGRSILMAMPKIIEQEQLNRKREQLMNRGLELIGRMQHTDILDFVDKVQKKALEVEEIDKIMKQFKKLKKEADFSIACPQCYKVKVNGAQIRCINDAHRVIIGHDIDKSVVIMPGKTILKKDDWEMSGSVICKCKCKLGELLHYKKARFILVSPKYWVFLDKDGVPANYKKWTSVPHHIDEVTPADIKEHLGIPPGDDHDDGNEASGAAAPCV